MDPLQKHRFVHTSLLRALFKAAKRVDADPALRALLTTPAEYTNMYNHYGERWEGPLLQLHDKRLAGAPGAAIPVSHAFFSFLQEINAGKSFFNPLDEGVSKRLYPVVVHKARALAASWKEAHPEGFADGEDTKLLAAAFFAMKCSKSVFDVVPLVESATQPQRKVTKVKLPGKGKKASVVKNPLVYQLPDYLKTLEVHQKLPVIQDSSEASAETPIPAETTDFEKTVKTNNEKATKNQTKTPKTKNAPKPTPQSAPAHFLVAHPMLDQCFRHAIILISAHRPTAAASVSTDDKKLPVHIDEVRPTRTGASKHRLKTSAKSQSERSEPDSSMGWVINLPVRSKNGDPLRVHDLKLDDHDDIFNECLSENIVFSGGPVGSPTMLSNRSHHALFLLYCGPLSIPELLAIKTPTAAKQEEAAADKTTLKVLPVAPGVHSICDLEFLRMLMQSEKVDRREILVILGYSGWGKSQLEGEVLQGTWFPASIDSAKDVRSLMLSYQKCDVGKDSPKEAKSTVEASATSKPSTGEKAAPPSKGDSGVAIKASQRAIAELAEKTRKELFATRTRASTSTVPMPVKMWSDFLHAMGPEHEPMSRLSAVLPLRSMSP